MGRTWAGNIRAGKIRQERFRQEGRDAMQFHPQSATPLEAARTAGRREDLTYQVITIAAMLIVLVSVWVF